MEIPINKAIEILDSNLKEICTVAEWAKQMGYDSPKYFSRKIRNYWGVRPFQLITQKKIEKFKQLIIEDSVEFKKNYSIARGLGLKDEIALYKYIKRNTGKSPTEWKERIEVLDRKSG